MAMSTISNGATIPLGTLIDFIVQKTYHDLAVLAELLPRKNDMERKIEIAMFAKRTQQLFVRLLALVKWANSASKVDKCAAMSEFLDRHNLYFVETADKLFIMAKNTLLQARLPCFSLPCAIDVLTSGTYPRLPTCIKEKIIPPDPVTEQEKSQVLKRISQVIEHRLVVSEIPRQMRVPHIYNGRVRFHVDNEFKVTMTLMGDSAYIPWRLLDITILVEDPEIGEGKSLVHPLQLNYIHQLVQSRLCDSEQPLVDLYCCLHSFCLSLQLEVLHSQAYRLVQQRFGDNLWLESYLPGRSLDLAYWRDSTMHEGKHGIQLVYKLSIHVDDNNSQQPLQVSHFPQILGSEGTRVAQTIRSDVLSLEKLLTHTIHVRSVARLRELEHELSFLSPAPCSLSDTPTVLSVSLLHPCLPSEMLNVSVSNTRGSYILSMADSDSETVRQLEASLNSDKHDLRQLLSDLRLELCMCRLRKSLQIVPGILVVDKLPVMTADAQDIKKLGKHVLFVKYSKHKDICLALQACPAEQKRVKVKYYLIHFEELAVSGEATSSDSNSESVAKVFVKPRELIELNDSVCLDMGCETAESIEDTHEALMRKRKLLLGEMTSDMPGTKRTKTVGSNFMPDVYFMVTFCENRIAHMFLTSQLNKSNIVSCIAKADNDAVFIKILKLPDCAEVSSKTNASLAANLVSCSIHLNSAHMPTSWQCEMIFASNPLIAMTEKKVCLINLSNEKPATDLLAVWTSIAHLYELVLKFSCIYNVSTSLQRVIGISSYAFDTLTFVYGSRSSFTMTVQYKIDQKCFQLNAGSLWASPNPHQLTLNQIQQEFNRTHCLYNLVQLIADTWSPLLAVSKLLQIPLCTAQSTRPQTVLSFALICLSVRHVRLIFRHLYTLDLLIQNGQCVTIRDGIYSCFDHSRLNDMQFAPIQGLKGFLALYADADSSMTSVSRRRSINDDQQPPSPAVIDMLDSLITQPFSQSMGSAKPMNATTSPSHNPSSPSTSQKIISQFSSPIGTGFPLASPPMMGIAAPSPSAPSPTTHIPSSPLNAYMISSPASQLFNSQGGSDTGATGNPSMYAAQTVTQSVRMSAPRSWTVPSFPTVLSHDAFCRMLTTSHMPDRSMMSCSPLEHFLGSILLRRHLQRLIQSEDVHFQLLPHDESNAIKFNTENLHCEVALAADQQSLQFTVSPISDVMSMWDASDLDILQKFFHTQVACPPYKTSALTSFYRLLALPFVLLRDCIRLMRLEIVGDLSLKWHMHWCLTMPYGMPLQLPIGTSAVICKEKFFFVLQLTRQDLIQPNSDSQVLVLPITYHIKTGLIQAPEKTTSMQVATTVNAILKRGIQAQQYVANATDVSLFEVIRFLLQNLEL